MATTKATTKKTATVSTTAQTTSTKDTEAKKTAPVKETTKTTAKKTTTKKTPAKKAPAKRTTAAKKVETEVFVQFGGHEVSEMSLIERVKEAWVAEGNKEASIKKISLYVKPEEYKAYYVINGSSAGALDI